MLPQLSAPVRASEHILWNVRLYGQRQNRASDSAPETQAKWFARELHASFHCIRRILSFLPSALDILAETVNCVAAQCAKNPGERTTKHYDGQGLFWDLNEILFHGEHPPRASQSISDATPPLAQVIESARFSTEALVWR